MDRDEIVSCPGVLALELPAGAAPEALTLSRDDAETVAGLVADDLRGLLPDIEQSRLALAGAHFDPVELLRPGFPLYTTLDDLAMRLPRERGGVLAFGAHEGRMPTAVLQPHLAYAGGAMRVLPWTLLAPPDVGRRLGEAMEVELVGRGEAGERTADTLMRLLGVRFEHARYLSRHDVLALSCVQYEHANLAPLWTLLEAALLSPEREERTLSARGLPLRYADGRVLADDPLAWVTTPAAGDTATRAHALAGIVFELRQYAALLGAHALPLHVGGQALVHGAAIHPVDDIDAEAGEVRLFAHEAPGLGVVAVSAAQTDGSRVHVLAHALPLTGRLDALCAWLADRYRTDPTVHRLGRLRLDDEGRLQVAAGDTLH